MKKKDRQFTNYDFVKLKPGKTFFVEYNMIGSKYHGSIFSITITDKHKYGAGWIMLEAPTLPRRISAHITHILKTTETIERLTATPSTKEVKKDGEFVDFSGYKFQVGDVLFGNGKLVRVTELNPTLCFCKIIHPTPGKYQQDTYNHRAQSMKNYLYVEDPTMILLKI